MHMKKQRRILTVLLALVMVLVVGIARPGLAAAHGPETDHDIALELIGQVAAPLPSRTLAYGYLSFIHGLPPEALAVGGTLTEGTAQFTFFVDTVNERVINNGPLRVIDRIGGMAIYRDASADGNWSRPETFQDGEQIVAATLRYQVVIDTVTGAFSAHWDLTSMWSKRFTINGAGYRLGKDGQSFTATVVGHLNQQAPPTAHIAGFVQGLALRK